MAVCMKLRGVEASFKELERRHQSTVKQNERLQTGRMISELRAATPVDTGEAQASWSRIETGKATAIINSTPYIQYLNAGHSDQAPPYFIERIAIKYGKPLGSIVSVIDN